MPGFVRQPRGAMKLSMRRLGRSCHWMLKAHSFEAAWKELTDSFRSAQQKFTR